MGSGVHCDDRVASDQVIWEELNWHAMMFRMNWQKEPNHYADRIKNFARMVMSLFAVSK
jgi:hypothetical protein